MKERDKRKRESERNKKGYSQRDSQAGQQTKSESQRKLKIKEKGI